MAGNPNPGNKWKPGERPEGAGRPVGARNRRTAYVIELIRSAGHQDPLLTLAELQAKSHDEGIRATAANMLAPYLHSKNATKPIAADPVYFEQAVSLPRPTTIRLACDNIALLTEMKSQGQLDVASADSLINDQRIILNALVDEAKLLAAQGDPTVPQKIIIEGGLPQLPGCENLIMPEINGHSLELSAIPTIPAQGSGDGSPVHSEEKSSASYSRTPRLNSTVSQLTGLGSLTGKSPR
jgi:hypothetical protein